MQVKKILFITLSNIGDVILTLPALDYLRARFPSGRVTVMTASRPSQIFENNPAIDRLIVYDKHGGFKYKSGLFSRLKNEKFDLVADLRNSLYGVFLLARYRTSALAIPPKQLKHMRDRHLYKVTRIQGLKRASGQEQPAQNSFYIRKEDRDYIDCALRAFGVKENDKIIVIAAGARSHIKRWAKENFAELIPLLVRDFGVKIVLVGDKDDLPINRYLAQQIGGALLDLTAKTSLAQLAYLLKRSELLVANDSAVLHLAGYFNVPVVAIFGPTDECKYGPWGKNDAVVKKEISCRPCAKAQCRFGSLKCMELVKTLDVLAAVGRVWKAGTQTAPGAKGAKKKYQRILITRTDRIGDVLLSTPVISALRKEYPCAYIAMMVSPYAKDIVEGNPYLDEVITYDKLGREKGWGQSIRFALNIKKKKFDLAVVLHPNNRTHLVTFIAGIPRRIGYLRDFGFLLTDRVRHTKQFGEKHESQYSLDILRSLGLEALDASFFMPVRPESERWLRRWLQDEGISQADKVLTIHPCASCPSRIWPSERFAEVADELARKYGFKVIVVAGPGEIIFAQRVMENMREHAINLAGKVTVSQLASVLKRSQLFISNDSGPVHIAGALGIPVISIFSRSQKGLSPRRWGPVGKKSRFLHKQVGCIDCLAHNCKKGFACLKAITASDVVRAADDIMSS